MDIRLTVNSDVHVNLFIKLQITFILVKLALGTS